MIIKVTKNWITNRLYLVNNKEPFNRQVSDVPQIPITTYFQNLSLRQQ